MSTAATETKSGITYQTAKRILREGYGEGAWHGPDLKAALADVTETTAFWRPGPERHSIAEIALHHAYCARGVRAKLTGVEPEPFVLEGDDWFTVSEPSALSWPAIRDVVALEHDRLVAALSVRTPPALAEPEQFDLVLGITCHAVYHAGQIQLIKRLAAE